MRRTINGAHQIGGRVALLWQPTSDFSVEASGIVYKSIQDNTDTVTYDPVTHKPFPGGGKLSNFFTRPQQTSENLQVYDLTAKWDLHWATATSVSSYQDFYSRYTNDITTSYGPYFDLALGSTGSQGSLTANPLVKKFTQEVRLASPTGDTLEWMAGGYYTHETTTQSQNLNAFDSTGTAIPGINPIEFAGLNSSYTEYAAFGNLTWHITQQLDLTGGVRYSHNHQTYTQPIGGLLLGTAPGCTDAANRIWHIERGRDDMDDQSQLSFRR